jgi:hypothetical protein
VCSHCLRTVLARRACICRSTSTLRIAFYREVHNVPATGSHALQAGHAAIVWFPRARFTGRRVEPDAVNG